MDKIKRRAAVKQAWLAGKVNKSQLSRQLQVSRETIARDLKLIEAEAAALATLEPSFAEKVAESEAFFAAMRDWAKDNAMKESTRINHNAKVGYARTAIAAEERRLALLGLNAPDKVEQTGEVVVRIAPPDGMVDVRPPIPAKHRGRLN